MTTGKAGPSFYSGLSLNFLLMSYTKEKPATAQKILDDLLYLEEARELRETLHELFYGWAQSKIKHYPKKRSEVLRHYRYLSEFLKDAEHYERERRAS